MLFPFDPATKKTLGDAGREAGLLLRRVHSTTLQLDDIDRSPRIAVFTNAVDQSVWSLRNLGFTADPIGTTALNGATDPLVDYDVVFSTAGWPVRGQPDGARPADGVLRRRRRLHRRRLRTAPAS